MSNLTRLERPHNEAKQILNDDSRLFESDLFCGLLTWQQVDTDILSGTFRGASKSWGDKHGLEMAPGAICWCETRCEPSRGSPEVPRANTHHQNRTGGT